MARTSSTVVHCFSLCALALVGCGDSVAPGDGSDVVLDARAEDRPTPDVLVTTQVDATVPDAASDVPLPDVLVPADASEDVERDAATPEVLDVMGERICGVSIVDDFERGEFALVYGYRSGRTNEARLVRTNTRGEVIMSATIAAGGAEPICVSRESLALAGGWSRDPTLSRVYIVALQRLDAARAIEMMVLDDRGTHLALGARDSAMITPAPVTASNLVLQASSGRVSVALEARLSDATAVRLIEWNAFTISRGAIAAPAIMQAQNFRLGPITADAHVALAPSGGGGTVVTWAESDSSTPSSRVMSRAFTPSGWAGPAVELARGDNVRPISQSLFYEGVRSVSLRSVEWSPWTSSPPSTPVTLAENTAWHQLDAVRDHNGLDTYTWVSHGSSGYNNTILHARRGEPMPERCVLFRAADEQSVFVQVAQARFASRNQLIAAIERARAGASERLRVRALGDGETVCP